MRPVALTLAWQFWRPNRWIITAMLAYLSLASLTLHLLPTAILSYNSGAMASVPMVMAVVYLVAVFAYGVEKGGSIESEKSCFPARQFTLPVPTPILVVWPMVMGATTLIVVWPIWAKGILEPCGIEAPLLWPGLMLAAFLCLLQALVWRPFRMPILRVLLLFLVLTPVAGIPFEPTLRQQSYFLTLLYVSAVLVSFVVAWQGVARARRGDGQEWPDFVRRAVLFLRGLGGEAPVFASPLHANLWFEWRRYGKFFVLFVSFYSILLLPLLPIISRGNSMDQLHTLAPELFAAIPNVDPLFYAVICLSFFPIMLATFISGDAPGQSALTSFLATRPMTGGEYVLAKLLLAARLSVFTQGLVFLLFPATLMLMGDWPKIMDSVRQLAAGHQPANVVAVIVLYPMSMFFLMWRQQVVGMYLGLAGRGWLMFVAAWTHIAIGGLSFWLGSWLFRNQSYLETVQRLLPWIMLGVVSLKLLAASCVFRVKLRRGMTTPRAVRQQLAIWLTATLSVILLANWLLPTPPEGAKFLVMATILFMPLVRIELAPLSLEWNWHR